MKRKCREYQEKLLHDLQDQELARAYLKEALMDEDQQIFVLALRNVCKAQMKKKTALAQSKNSQD